MSLGLAGAGHATVIIGVGGALHDAEYTTERRMAQPTSFFVHHAE